MLNDILYICGGLKYTIVITVIVLILSLYIGYHLGVIRFCTKSKILLYIINTYVYIFRYTPLIFQFSITVKILINYINLSVLCALILSLNSAAYISNIILDSLNAIELSYWITLEGLNIGKYKGIKYFLYKNIINNGYHSLQNEIINITKESSLIGIIGVADIFFRAREISILNYEFMIPLMTVGIIYFLVNFLQEKYFSQHIIKVFIFILNK